MTHKEYKNKVLVQSFCKASNNRFFSMKVAGKAISTTKNKVKFYSNRLIINDNVYKYIDIRKLKQGNRIINL